MALFRANHMFEKNIKIHCQKGNPSNGRLYPIVSTVSQTAVTYT